MRCGQKIKNKKFFKRINLIREVRKCRKQRKTVKQAKIIILQPLDKVKDLYLVFPQGLQILFCALYGNCLADTQTPTRWRKLTVCCPQASQPQTIWKQKVDDAASSLPDHRPWLGKHCETPHYHHQAGSTVLRLCLLWPSLPGQTVKLLSFYFTQLFLKGFILHHCTEAGFWQQIGWSVWG